MKSRLIGRLSIPFDQIRSEIDILDMKMMQTSTVHAVGIWGRLLLYTDKNGWHESSKKFPLICDFVEQICDLNNIYTVQIFYSEAGGFLRPHRDWGSKRPKATRVHIPIQADVKCYMAENQHLFHMAPGEVWTLAVSEWHSSGCFSVVPRIHLVLDFLPNLVPDHLLAMQPCDGTNITLDGERRKWSIDQENSIKSLSILLNKFTLSKVIDLISVIHFDWDVDCSHGHKWIEELTFDDESVKKRVDNILTILRADGFD